MTRATFRSTLAVTMALAGLAGCDRTGVPGVERGMTRREAFLAVVGGDEGKLQDTLLLLSTRGRYLVAGDSVQVVYYAPDPIPSDVNPYRDGLLHPIVIRGDTVRAVGWKEADAYATEHNIGLPKHDR